MIKDINKLIGRKFTYDGKPDIHTVMEIEHRYEDSYYLKCEQDLIYHYDLASKLNQSEFHFESLIVKEADELIERIKFAYQVPKGASLCETHISTLLIDIVEFVKRNMNDLK